MFADHITVPTRHVMRKPGGGFMLGDSLTVKRWIEEKRLYKRIVLTIRKERAQEKAAAKARAQLINQKRHEQAVERKERAALKDVKAQKAREVL